MIPKYPPAFPDFPHLVYGGDYNPDQWLQQPDILREDIRMMRLARMNSATIGIFAWSALEPQEGVYTFDWLDEAMDRLHAAGMRVVLATPSGGRPAWLDRRYPEAMRVAANGMRNLHGVRHNHCYTAPIFRDKVNRINTELARRYGRHPALSMWHLSNEYNGECYCPLCQQAFRDWLKARYGSIAALNDAWWTSFWSHTYTAFDQIDAPVPNGETSIHGLTLDWKRFVTDQTADFIRAEAAPLKAANPAIPVTTNMMSLFTQLNYAKIAPHLDVISWDDYPAWHNDEEKLWETAQRDAFNHDWFRCMRGGQPFLLMESTPSHVNWQPVEKLKRPGVLALGAMNAIAHGSDSVQYFQWRKGRGGTEKFHGAVVDHVGHEHTRVFREVTDLGKTLASLDGVVGTSVRPQVGLIWDVENGWALDNLGSLQKRKYVETCIAHHRPFWRRGIPVDVIESLADFSSYTLLVAPMLYMLRPGVASRLLSFAHAGGTVVLTHHTGYVDDSDLCHTGGFPGDGLKELAGIWAEELDSLYPTDENRLILTDGNRLGLQGQYRLHTFCEIIHPQPDCQVLATYGADFYCGLPVLTYNPHGKGGCYYLAARTDEDFLDAWYDKLIKSLSLRSVSALPLPEGVHVALREGSMERYLFYLNCTDQAQQVGDIALPPYGTAVRKESVRL